MKARFNYIIEIGDAFCCGKKRRHVKNFFSITSLQARRRISSTVKAIIEERRRRRGHLGDHNSKKNDFLEILLYVDTLSEDEKISFVLDSLLGGYETTSLLMSMVVYFLGQSTSALEQLKVHTCNFLFFSFLFSKVGILFLRNIINYLILLHLFDFPFH